MFKEERISRSAQKTKAALRRHVNALVSHTRQVVEYGGHGHAAGRQGSSGHPLPKSNLNLQANANLQQNTCDGYGADDPDENDYGLVDKGS